MSHDGLNISPSRSSVPERNIYVTTKSDEGKTRSSNNLMKSVDNSNYVSIKTPKRTQSESDCSRSKEDPKTSFAALKTPLDGTLPPNSDKEKAQTGMDRYVIVTKRKRSPKSANIASQHKVARDSETASVASQNRFAILGNDDNVPTTSGKSPKPPPIYLRQASSNIIIKNLIETIGENSFYTVPVRRGKISETKIQVLTEDNYRKVVKTFEETKKSFYTYQLKSEKGLQVIIKGVDPSVATKEIKDSLESLGFKVKNVINLINKEKVPQPIFRVELEPGKKKLKKGEVHSIYNVRYLLHRRVTIEEPYKRSGPVQCQNCQEFGHSKTYCKLHAVCVVCGDLHSTANCKKPKGDPKAKKCSNCGENHTANYRGCRVYSLVRSSSNQIRNVASRTQEQLVTNDYPQLPTSNNQQISYANILKANSATPLTRSALKTNNNTTNISSKPTVQPQPINSSQMEAKIEMLVQTVQNFVNTMLPMMQTLINMQTALLQAVTKSP